MAHAKPGTAAETVRITTDPARPRRIGRRSSDRSLSLLSDDVVANVRPPEEQVPVQETVELSDCEYLRAGLRGPRDVRALIRLGEVAKRPPSRLPHSVKPFHLATPRVRATAPCVVCDARTG